MPLHAGIIAIASLPLQLNVGLLCVRWVPCSEIPDHVGAVPMLIEIVKEGSSAVQSAVVALEKLCSHTSGLLFLPYVLCLLLFLLDSLTRWPCWTSRQCIQERFLFCTVAERA